MFGLTLGLNTSRHRLYRSTRLSSFNLIRSVDSAIQNVSTLDFSRRYHHEEKHEKVVQNNPIRRQLLKVPRNPYQLFIKDQEDSAAVIEQYGIGGYSTEMGKRWKELDESKKEEYKLKSQRMQDAEKMTLKNPEYFEAVLRSPILKVPQNRGYYLFLKDHKDSSAVMKKIGSGGYSKEMSKRWKELDESKKAEYKLKSKRMQEEYEYKMKNDPEYFSAVLRSRMKVKRDYHLFLKDQKDSAAVWKQYGLVGYNKEMSKRWKELDESKREEYKLKSQRMQEVRMQGEKMTLKNPEYFEAVLRSPILKVPQNRGYSLFIKDQEDSSAVMKQNGFGGYNKEMSKRWKELDESKKEEYKLKSKRMQEEYENSVLLAPTDRH